MKLLTIFSIIFFIGIIVLNIKIYIKNKDNEEYKKTMKKYFDRFKKDILIILLAFIQIVIVLFLFMINEG